MTKHSTVALVMLSIVDLPRGKLHKDVHVTWEAIPCFMCGIRAGANSFTGAMPSVEFRVAAPRQNKMTVDLDDRVDST